MLPLERAKLRTAHNIAEMLETCFPELGQLPQSLWDRDRAARAIAAAIPDSTRSPPIQLSGGRCTT